MRPILPPRALLGAIALAAGLGLLAACGGGAPQDEAAAPVSATDGEPEAAAVGDSPPTPAEAVEDERVVEEEQAGEDEAAAAEEPSFLSKQNRRTVTLFFQDPGSDLLMPEERQIFETNSLTDQAKQIVVGVIDGPQNPSLLPTVPEKTRVLGLYMDREGTAWVDLSHEVVSDHMGGTSEELATIFSLVDSLTVSLPEIKRVHFLVNGEERDTLSSHVDLRRDFVQDLSIVHGNDG